MRQRLSALDLQASARNRRVNDHSCLAINPTQVVHPWRIVNPRVLNTTMVSDFSDYIQECVRMSRLNLRPTLGEKISKAMNVERVIGGDYGNTVRACTDGGAFLDAV